MKLIILAAGEGTRLRPYTNDRPKCMVEYQGKPILNHILTHANEAGISDISIVTGYKEEVLTKYANGIKSDLKYYHNENFNSSNMVSSLFCARKEFTEDIIISYADIIYSTQILNKLKSAPYPFSVIIDQDWKSLWSIRMEDPLSDAETLKINNNGQIFELGKKPQDYKDIEGQYMGLIKISKDTLPKITEYYDSLDKQAIYDGKNFDNMFMTSFIQNIIDNLMPVNAVFVTGGWLEIDSVEDLNRYNKISYLKEQFNQDGK